MKSDERRCAAGFRCADHTVREGKRVPALLKTPAGLCGHCLKIAASASAALPHDWCKLKVAIGESRRVVSESTSRPKPESKVLLNLESDALMQAIVSESIAAARLVSDRMNVRVLLPRNRSSAVAYRCLVRAVRLVVPNVEMLAGDEDGALLVLRLVELHRRVVSHLGETAQRERLHLPCPSCSRSALVREVQDRRGRELVDGSSTPEVIRCQSCQNIWSESEYQWLSQMVRSEREEYNMLKWLLAEANWRLSKIVQIADAIAEPDSGLPSSLASLLRDYLPSAEAPKPGRRSGVA